VQRVNDIREMKHVVQCSFDCGAHSGNEIEAGGSPRMQSWDEQIETVLMTWVADLGR